MRKGALFLAITAVLALAGCGSGTTGTGAVATSTSTTPAGPSAATVMLSGTSFASSAPVTISAGQSVTFVDPSIGAGPHDLVTRTNGMFTSTPGAPGPFANPNGLNIGPGDTRVITFPTAGTYMLTCTIHPAMELTITVTA